MFADTAAATNVISDTRAKWDVPNQQWVVVGHYDSAECLDWGAEQDLVEVEFVPANPWSPART